MPRVGGLDFRRIGAILTRCISDGNPVRSGKSTMKRQILCGKIHIARLTGCELDYEGSLEIDPELLAAGGILPYEKILVVNRSNGSRLETYAIPGEPGRRQFCLNGPAAHLGKVGDVVTIMAFALADEAEARTLEPKIIVMNERNEIVERKGRR